MRRSRTALWLGVFLLGAAAPAFCQVIVPPNISGRTIPTDIGTTSFLDPVYSTGPFDATLLVFRNGQLKFFSSATICTSGPLTTVNISIPFGRLGLAAGDAITFAFAVHHQNTEGNTSSLSLSFIPVVAGSSSSSGPTPTSRATPVPPSSGSPAAARKEELDA